MAASLIAMLIRSVPQILRALGGGAGGRTAGGAVAKGAGKMGVPTGAPTGGSAGGSILDAAGAAGQLMWGAQSLMQGLGLISKAITSIPLAPVNAMIGAFDKLQAPALAVVGVLGKARDSMTAFGRSLAEFVQLVSPVHVERFMLAADDLTASIGKALLPAMEFATKLTRRFADVMYTMSGPLQRLMKAFFDPLEAVVDRLATVAGHLLQVLNPLIEVFALVVEGVGKLVIGLMKFLGLSGGGLEDSTDAAVRNVGIGSLEDYGKRAQTAAFRLGTAAAPEERTATFLEKIYGEFKPLIEFMIKMLKMPLEAIEGIYEVVMSVLESGPKVKDKMKEMAKDGAATARGVLAKIDGAHTDLVRGIEDRGVPVPEVRPWKWEMFK